MKSVRKHWGGLQRGRNSLPHIVAVLSGMRGVEVAINTRIDDYSGSCWKCSASLLISDPLWAVSRRPGEWWGAVHPSKDDVLAARQTCSFSCLACALSSSCSPPSRYFSAVYERQNAPDPRTHGVDIFAWIWQQTCLHTLVLKKISLQECFWQKLLMYKDKNLSDVLNECLTLCWSFRAERMWMESKGKNMKKNWWYEEKTWSTLEILAAAIFTKKIQFFFLLKILI